MSYELSVKKETNYLYVQVTGVRTLETVMAMAAEVLSLCVEHRYSRVLLDIQEMIGALDAVDAYEFGGDYLPNLVPTGEIKVAVIDGGVDLDHPAFSGSVSSGYDYVDDDQVANDEIGGANSGHGTFVAGVVHLVAPDAEIISYRVTNLFGESNGYVLAEAILKAIDDGCRVINISLVTFNRLCFRLDLRDDLFFCFCGPA